MSIDETLTDFFVYGDRLTWGADEDRRKGANNVITVKSAQEYTDRRRAARLREIAKRYPYMSPPVMVALARGTGPLTDAEIAPIAYADSASQGQQGIFGATRSNPTPQGQPPRTVIGGSANVALQPGAAPAAQPGAQPLSRNPSGAADRAAQGSGQAVQTVQPTVPTNPRGADFQAASEDLQDVPEILDPVRTVTSATVATLMTPFSALYDVAYRRPAGVRQEVGVYADRFEMDPATRYAFASRIAGQDQLSAPGMLEPFMPDDPRDPANADQVIADYEAGRYDKDKVEQALQQWNDPEDGYAGNSQGGLAERLWYVTPLGQLVTNGGWSESWFGMPEDNHRRIQEFNEATFDLRGTDERVSDAAKYAKILTAAAAEGQLQQLDPGKLLATFGPRGGTMGRYVAEYRAGYAPDTWPYRLLSGGIDALTVLATDPVNLIPAARLTTMGKLGLNAADRAALRTPGLRTFVGGKTGRTAAFEATRVVRQARRSPEGVIRTADDINPDLPRPSTIEWRDSDGVSYPVAPGGEQMQAHGVQHVNKWEAVIGGQQHAIIRDNVTGKYGYVGPLDITRRYDRFDDLQAHVQREYLPEIEDRTRTLHPPVPSSVTDPDVGSITMVRTEDVKRFAPRYPADQNVIGSLRGTGEVTEPILVTYNPETGLAWVTSSKERLIAAFDDGLEYVPVRVETDPAAVPGPNQTPRRLATYSDVTGDPAGSDLYWGRTADSERREAMDDFFVDDAGEVYLPGRTKPVPRGDLQPGVGMSRVSKGVWATRDWDGRLIEVRAVSRSRGRDSWAAFDAATGEQLSEKMVGLKAVREWLNTNAAEAYRRTRTGRTVERPAMRGEFGFPGGRITEEADGGWLKTFDADVEDLRPHSYTSASGSTYTKMPDGDGVWGRTAEDLKFSFDEQGQMSYSGGMEPPKNTVWVASDETEAVRHAITTGRLRIDEDGNLVGVRLVRGDSFNEEVFTVSKKRMSIDKAWEKAGGTVEDVTIVPSRNPEPGLYTVQLGDEGEKARVGGLITEVEKRPFERQQRFDSGDEAVQSVYDDFYDQAVFRRAPEWTVVGKDDGSRVATFDAPEKARDDALRRSGQASEDPESYLTIKQVDDFLRFTSVGQKVVEALRVLTSPAEIWRISGGKIDIETATLLAKAETAGDVYAVLGTRVGTNITDASALSRLVGVRSSMVDVAYRTGQRNAAMREISRLGTLAPRSSGMRLDDPDEVIEQMMRWGRGVGHKWETVDGVVGIRDYIDAYVALKDSPGGRYRIFNERKIGFWDYVVRGAMQRAGVPSDVSHDLSRAFVKRINDKEKAYKSSVLPEERTKPADSLVLDVFGPDTDLNLIADNRVGEGTWLTSPTDDFPLFLDEAMRTFMPVPDYRAVRRQINLMGRAIRKMPVGSEQAAKAHELAGQIVTGMTTAWRNLTLMNPAYFVRNVGEEMFRMGINGDASAFTNPLQAISTAITIAASRESANRTSKVIQTLSLLGMPNMIRKVQKGAIDPEGVEMVALQNLSGKYTQPRAEATATAVSGRTISQDRLAASLANYGPAEPILVAYDPAKQIWRVEDGHKRLAAFESMPDGKRPDAVPVKIVEKTLPADGVGVVDVPVTATTKTVRTPHRAKPLLEVDDTLHKATPEHLFGKGASKGNLASLMRRGETDLNEASGLSAMLSYAMPLMRRKYAYLNGDAWNSAHNAALNGNWEDVKDPITRMSTLAGGGYMQDEAAGRIRGLGITTYKREEDSQRSNYIRLLAVRHKQLSDLPHVKQLMARHPLEPDMNAYIDDLIQRKPDEVRKLLSLLPPTDEYTSLPDLVKGGLDTMRDPDLATVRNLLAAQLETAWLMSGKGNPLIAEAMHTGVFKGRRIGDDNKEYLKELDKIMDDPMLRVAFPDKMSGYPPVQWSAGNAKEWAKSRPAKMVEWFFNTAGENRDLLTASPLMRKRYEIEAEELVPHMTPAARRAVIGNLREAGDHGLADKLQRAADRTDSDLGWIDADAAHMLAATRSAKHMQRLFYDAAERRNWAVAMRVIMPFAQAQVNTMAVWGKLLLDNPVAAYRTLRPITAFRDEWSMSSYDLLSQMYGGPEDEIGVETVYEPFLHYDESGDDRYLMPAFGSLARLIGIEATASGTMSSLNLMGGWVPGFGPTVSVPASFFATGVINSPTFTGDVARALWKYPLPQGSAVDKVMGSLLPGKWQDGLVAAGDSTNPEFVKKQMAMLQQIMATGTKKDGTPFRPGVEADLNEAMDQATVKAQQLLWLETFVKVFLPAGGPVSLDPDTAITAGDSDTVRYVANREMAQVWRSYTGNVPAADYGKRVMEFDKDFGTFVQFPFAPVTDNSDAPPLTFEMQQIAADLPETFSNYRELWRYVMPKGDPFGDIFTEPRLAKFREQQQQQGMRKALKFRDVANVQYQYLLNGALKARLEEIERTYPGDGAAKQRARAEAQAMGLVQVLELDKAKTSLERVREMVADEVARDAIPGGRFIADYIAARDREVAALQNVYTTEGTPTGDLSTQGAFFPSQRLTYLANQYIAQDRSGSFQQFWETLARVELGDNADIVEETA